MALVKMGGGGRGWWSTRGVAPDRDTTSWVVGVAPGSSRDGGHVSTELVERYKGLSHELEQLEAEVIAGA